MINKFLYHLPPSPDQQSILSLQPGLRLGSVGDNHLGAPLTDAQHRQHGVDGGDGGEDTGVGDTDLVEPAQAQLRIDDGQRVALDVAHARRARGVVHGVRDAARVLADLLVGLDLGAGCDLALDPVLEGSLLGDLARHLDAVHERRGVVALRVREVAEVERGLDLGVRRGQVQAAARPRAGDVGRHAEGVAVGRLRVAQPRGVEGEGDLVAVHHDVGNVAVGDGLGVGGGGLLAGGVGRLAAEEDAGVRVHGGLALGHGLVELPHDDALGVVDEVLADALHVADDGDAKRLELVLGSET
ncbi:hypothetical protein ACKVWC_011604 [Pyricularia oryzae]